MKLHKKFDHNLKGVGYWGERPEINIRVNFGIFKAGEFFPEDPLHYHKTRKTYFCVLEGSLDVEVAGDRFTVTEEVLLEVLPMEKYRTLSVGVEGCKYIVIGSHNNEDKVVVDK